MSATITPSEFYAEIAAGQVPQILDVRNADEYAAAAIEGSRPVVTSNVPVWRVFEALEEIAKQTPEGAVIVCGQGDGSELVADEFEALGVRTRSLLGGAEAWARLLVPKEILGLPNGIRAWQVLRPAKACLSYVVGVPGGSCVVVDPARVTDPYLDLAAEHDMRITHVVDTHLHADHISGGPALSQAAGAQYHLPPEDVGAVLPFPNRPLVDGERIDLGTGDGEGVLQAMTMHLPGHTPGTTALLVGDRLLMCGDTVFVRGLGRPDLTGQAESLARDLFHSVHERLQPLPPDTIIAPAHWSTSEEIGPDGLVTTTVADVFTSTLMNEHAIERFIEEIVSSLPAAPDTYDTIRAVNAGRVLPDDELDILDVGRNQCAASTTLKR